jgi:hypothetical protein
MSSSISEFATSQGLTRQAVLKAINDGRIQSAWKMGRQWRLDPIAAARELEANSHPGLARNCGGGPGRVPAIAPALAELPDLDMDAIGAVVESWDWEAIAHRVNMLLEGMETPRDAGQWD